VDEAAAESSWEHEAENWVRWVRTPGHDAYWYYRDSFLDGIVPPPGRQTLEIGCGEGRVARDLNARGHRVVAYNSLMDIADMPGAVREAARVLEPAGRFCISVTHPLNDAGLFESTEPDAPFVIRGSYFGRRPFEGHFERDGLRMTFRGWTYALEDYSRALEAAGFVVERVREPAATDAAVHKQPGYRRWQRLPLFLQLRAVKR